ncbi:hypothetical protein CO615_10565 [Lysobacteraceae bacterium NML75-0749]|nr:hypothetical protein CO615_10565 [Xanthomonadaceae bacterium NML75-0749]
MQNVWHRNYAAESIKRIELSEWTQDANFEWFQAAASCGQVVELLIGGSDEFASAVATTVRNTIRGGSAARHVNGRWMRGRGISHKQTNVIARALAEQFGTARAVAAMVWGLTDEEIDNAEVD